MKECKCKELQKKLDTIKSIADKVINGNMQTQTAVLKINAVVKG